MLPRYQSYNTAICNWEASPPSRRWGSPTRIQTTDNQVFKSQLQRPCKVAFTTTLSGENTFCEDFFLGLILKQLQGFWINKGIIVRISIHDNIVCGSSTAILKN